MSASSSTSSTISKILSVTNSATRNRNLRKSAVRVLIGQVSSSGSTPGADGGSCIVVRSGSASDIGVKSGAKATLKLKATYRSSHHDFRTRDTSLTQKTLPLDTNALLSITRRSTTVTSFSRSMSSSTGPSKEAPENTLPPSPFPIFTTLKAFRKWRREQHAAGRSVGFVPTMGALHLGHLNLVRHSLLSNDLTVVSIFVNPAQFAPHEDLAVYPRTIREDVAVLSQMTVETTDTSSSKPKTQRSVSAVLLPSVKEMYPFGVPSTSPSSPSSPPLNTQPLTVSLPALSTVLEGRTRPHFFTGVLTVLHKLFNVIQPHRAYFGQKDIQQATVVRRAVAEGLGSWPGSRVPKRKDEVDEEESDDDNDEGIIIIPTTRAPYPESDGLALSSRNRYLTAAERAVAGRLYAALLRGRDIWDNGGSAEEVLLAAQNVILSERQDEKQDEVVVDAKIDGVDTSVKIKLDYISLNDPYTLQPIPGHQMSSQRTTDAVIMSGAMWVGTTRLIDNMILGDESKILYDGKGRSNQK